MSDHEQLREAVASWVLGAAETDETELLRAHLESCPSCREMANRFGRAVHALPLTVDEVVPPPRLRARILAAAAASPRAAVAAESAQPKVLPVPTTSRRFVLPVFGRIPTYAAAAAVILALVVGLVAGSVAGNRPPAPAPSQVARFTLTGHGGLAGATASVIDLKADGVVLVAFNGLPAPPPGKVYELWMITSSSRADPGGVFVPDRNGATLVVVNGTLKGYVTMAVTTEQGPDGSKIPSQQPEMSGSVA